MDETIAFVNRVIDAEYRALRASYTEPDDDAYLRLHREAEALFDNRPGHVMALGFGRPPGESPERLAELAGAAEQFAPRTLFVVRRRRHPTRGDVFEAVVGPSRRSAAPQYDERWLVARVDGTPKVIARYARDRARRDEPAWELVSGTDLTELGPALEVRRLTPPSKPAQRADWDAA